MGYCIHQTDCQFRIDADKKAEALAAMKAMDPSVKGQGMWNNKKQWSWVDQEDVKKATSLEEALAEWMYEPKTDEEGNIIGLSFVGEKIGQEDVLLEVLAPFVKSGSFLEMQGEDGSVWRWVIKDGTMREITPTVSWEE